MWLAGTELEAVLDAATDEELRAIDWAGGVQPVVQNKRAPAQMLVSFAGRMVHCPKLGMGASRVVHALGKNHVIKYEYTDTTCWAANVKEQRVATLYTPLAALDDHDDEPLFIGATGGVHRGGPLARRERSCQARSARS